MIRQVPAWQCHKVLNHVNLHINHISTTEVKRKIITLVSTNRWKHEWQLLCFQPLVSVLHLFVIGLLLFIYRFDLSLVETSGRRSYWPGKWNCMPCSTNPLAKTWVVTIHPNELTALASNHLTGSIAKGHAPSGFILWRQLYYAH